MRTFLSGAHFLRWLALCLAVFGSAAGAWATTVAVAEVTLVAGEVLRYPAAGKSQVLKAADKLYEGDRVVTSNGAVAHLKFVDGAHVGLRESSELKINVYRAINKFFKFLLNSSNSFVNFYLVFRLMTCSIKYIFNSLKCNTVNRRFGKCT